MENQYILIDTLNIYEIWQLLSCNGQVLYDSPIFPCHSLETVTWAFSDLISRSWYWHKFVKNCKTTFLFQSYTSCVLTRVLYNKVDQAAKLNFWQRIASQIFTFSLCNHIDMPALAGCLEGFFKFWKDR